MSPLLIEGQECGWVWRTPDVQAPHRCTQVPEHVGIHRCFCGRSS